MTASYLLPIGLAARLEERGFLRGQRTVIAERAIGVEYEDAAHSPLSADNLLDNCRRRGSHHPGHSARTGRNCRGG